MAGSRGFLRAMGGPFVVVSLVLGGCDAILALGPSATIAEPEGGAGDAAVVDAGARLLVCGLPGHPMKGCNECIRQRCCSTFEACSADETCVAGAACLQQCDFDYPCLQRCIAEHQPESTTFGALQDCSFSQCTAACVPSGTCFELLSCCRRMGDPLLRASCLNVATSEDDVQCTQRYETVFAPACPVDAGGD